MVKASRAEEDTLSRLRLRPEELDESDLTVDVGLERELGELRLAVDLEHLLLAESPHADHGARLGLGASVVAVEADVDGDGALDRLDDVEEADSFGPLRQGVAAVRAAGGLHQPMVDERLEDLRQEVLRNHHLTRDLSEGDDRLPRDGSEIDHGPQAVVDLAGDAQDVLHGVRSSGRTGAG